MALELENIGGQVCEPIAGVSALYYALLSDFETINDTKKICSEDPLEVAATFAELAEIETAHVFKAGKSFKQLTAITNTGAITSTQIGETERHLFTNELVCEIADSTAAVLGAMRYLKNQKLIVLVEEFGSGRVRQLGWSRLPALMNAQLHNVEAATEGKNSATLTFGDTNFGPSPIYKGAIQLIPTP
jgi:hypothetical protein